ncbi:MAG: hypothetical protein M4579_004806 [Chaenotheca gracillima]|nr:MAG: hypothetical protein M4579_004806 [Chaenotheca gracillima]
MSSSRSSRIEQSTPKRGRSRQDVLASLRETQMVSSRSVLPAEIISMILDYLPIPDLTHFALVSRRMQEMVYDDTRWVRRLKLMGCWNEREARKRIERETQKQHTNITHNPDEGYTRTGSRPDHSVNGDREGLETPESMLFDASLEEEKQKQILERANRTHHAKLTDGFEAMSFSSQTAPSDVLSKSDPDSPLNVLSTVKSARGFARQEYGRVYKALAPFYGDVVKTQGHADPLVFRVYQVPEQQAGMLSQLNRFAQSDISEGWSRRQSKLVELTDLFEDAALREFEHGCREGEVKDRMRKYAQVLVTLNGGRKAVDAFLEHSPVFANRYMLGNPMDCLDQASLDNISLEPSTDFFNRLGSKVNQQSEVIDVVFPDMPTVILNLMERVSEVNISEYITTLFDEAHNRSIESYLKAVSGIYEQVLRFTQSIRPTANFGDSFGDGIHSIIAGLFEPHVDLYLQEELDFFKKRSDAQVSSWERKLSEQDASTESFFMSNFNRQADKRDFLSSFKKVVMMPVNVLPTMSFSTSKSTSSNQVPANGDPPASSRSATPGLLGPQAPTPIRTASPALGLEAPTTELAAKVALMNSRLEGIRSLFSIEVALNLVHAAKASLERVALFVYLGGQTGELAKEQCETIFVLLLNILGSRHIKPGFDTAVNHLAKYDPQTAGDHSKTGVAPLVMFLELVSVGDLIQQMLDVFYEQELIATKLTDRNDFLDPAVKEKKRFEQMLDERVAAGLNKGIEVLMDEVEYLFATTQSNTDFHPEAAGHSLSQGFDVGPTTTAKQVVEIVSSHTKMLVGSTDKNMLDVFNQEVGIRLFTALCKHLKRQRVSIDGAIKLISDMNLYFTYIQTLKNNDLLEYFKALREVSQIYLIDPSHSKEMATIIADGDRFYGIFGAEEVYEFAERRADWYQVKKGVERAMYGIGCALM